MMDAHKTNLSLAFGALLAASGTLVCCVLPALLVSIGAGAVLIGLVSAVPQLVWLSEHKPWVFGTAAVLLTLSGIAIWRARRLPCPVEPAAAKSCTRLRRMSAAIYCVSLICFAVGAVFAFVLPLIAPGT